MICPKCGSDSSQVIVEKKTTGSDFSLCDGLLGYICLGPVGILCGACGGNKKYVEVKYCQCNVCGNKFKL